MKIGKSRLKQVIKEELEKLDEIPGWRKLKHQRDGTPHPGLHPGPRKGEAEKDEAWVGGTIGHLFGVDDNPDVSQDPDGFKTAKKPIPLEFRYAEADETIETKEGPVGANAGDAIMTGTEGEQWPIPAEKFAQTYNDLGDGTAAKKNIPVFAKQMMVPFKVKVSWSNDLLQGAPGDYLVQYGPGDYGVVGREIFAKTYKA